MRNVILEQQGVTICDRFPSDSSCNSDDYLITLWLQLYTEEFYRSSAPRLHTFTPLILSVRILNHGR